MKKQQISQTPYQQNIQQQKVGAITRKCQYCQSQVPAKEKICPNCHKKLKGISAPAALIIIVLIIGFAIIMAILPKKSTPNNISASPNINITEPLEILDCSTFSRISVEALCEKLGDPKGIEDWNNKTSKGDFQMQIYSYDFDDYYAEFITYENNVVKLRLFSNTNWKIEGSEFNNVFSMFGVVPGENIQKTVDTGVTYKFSPVSDKVAEFEIYDYDSKNKTFDTVYVTYNLNYFD